MRVLLVNDYGTPTGGAEYMMLMCRDELRARGHEARLFTSSARPGGAEVLADYSCPGTTSSFRTLLQSWNPWAARRLAEAVEELAPDVVHVRMFLTQLSPAILPVLRGRPAVYSAVDYRPVCPVGSRRLPDGASCDHPVGRACHREGCLPLRDWVPIMGQMKLWDRWRDAFDLVTVASQWMARRLRALGFPADRVIPNAVPVRPPRPPLDGPPTVGFAGRLVPTKGADILIAAMARVRQELPDARLLIVGGASGSTAGGLKLRHHGVLGPVRFLDIKLNRILRGEQPLKR